MNFSSIEYMKYITYSDNIGINDLYGKDLVRYCNFYHINKIFQSHEFESIDVCKNKIKMPKFKIKNNNKILGKYRLISERKCHCTNTDSNCEEMVIGLVLNIDLYDSTILEKSKITEFEYRLYAFNDTSDECKIKN